MTELSGAHDNPFFMVTFLVLVKEIGVMCQQPRFELNIFRVWHF